MFVREVQLCKAKYDMMEACISPCINMSGWENKDLLKLFVTKRPPAACVRTQDHKHPRVHVCTRPHVFRLQKVTLRSSSEPQRSQHLHLTYLCQAAMTDRRDINHHRSLLPLPLMCPEVIPACSFHIGEGGRGGEGGERCLLKK